MGRETLFVLSVLAFAACALAGTELNLDPTDKGPTVPADWLVSKIETPARVHVGSDSVVMENGLVTRKFSIVTDSKGATKGFGTTGLYSLSRRGAAILRAVGPEATVQLDEHEYQVGGLMNTPQTAFMDDGSPSVTVNPDAFTFKEVHSVSDTTDRGSGDVPWTPGTRGAPKDVSWPPKGCMFKVDFQAPSSAPPEHRGIVVTITYLMYEGVPLLSKFISIHNGGDADVRVVTAAVESLDIVDYYSPYPTTTTNPVVVSMGNAFEQDFLSRVTFLPDIPYIGNCTWTFDPSEGESQPGSFKPTVRCAFSSNAGTVLKARGGSDDFVSFRVMTLVTDSTERERFGLAYKRMVRLLAPWVQENPVFFHNTKPSPDDAKRVIDQLAETGFEMMIFSFGSGFDFESTDDKYIEELSGIVSYAKSKGIEVGGYDLIVLARGAQKGRSVVNKDGSLGDNLCLGSVWKDELDGFTKTMTDKVGLTMLETDGPYGGSDCYAEDHPYHKDHDDSIYEQARIQTAYYQKLRAKNIFVNQPDYYLFVGGSKVGMGYDENQYSLPRWEDLSISRQTMYKRMALQPITAVWMFLPIDVYHSGGDAAKFEPLHENLADYEWGLAQYLGYGVAACYRGGEVYDTPETKAVVQKWVSFYHKYRDILSSESVGVREPTNQAPDAILHVNPFIDNRGLLMVYNPLTSAADVTLDVPLYYTGITDTACIEHAPSAFNGSGEVAATQLNRDYTVTLDVSLPPRGVTYFVIRSGDGANGCDSASKPAPGLRGEVATP